LTLAKRWFLKVFHEVPGVAGGHELLVRGVHGFRAFAQEGESDAVPLSGPLPLRVE
jgi:hypothetical protein